MSPLRKSWDRSDGYRSTRSSMTSPTVSPAASSSRAPPTSARSVGGMRTRVTGAPFACDGGGVWGTGRFPTFSRRRGQTRFSQDQGPLARTLVAEKQGEAWCPIPLRWRTRAEGERWSCPLADLPPHVLVAVANSLALVRLGWAHLADLSGCLADHLLVDPLDDDLRRSRHVEGDPGPGLDDHGVGIADGELELGAFELGAVADTLDLELLLESLRHSLDHIRDERPREAVERTVITALGRPRHDDLGVGVLDLHTRRDDLAQL